MTGGFGGLLPSRSVSRVFINSVSVWEYCNKRKKNIQLQVHVWSLQNIKAQLNWECFYDLMNIAILFQHRLHDKILISSRGLATVVTPLRTVICS